MAAVTAVVLVGLVVLGTGAGERSGGYTVRAIFDNVAAAVPGEDVKVAGAKVGQIDSMDVTPQNKAAVVLRIDDGRFAPFRANARCTVRPQSLIGEKFVECSPGTSSAQPLRKISDGPGKGQYLLPLARTSSPVDLDLVNDIMRRPYRERFAILLAELGTATAGRGKDLNQLIRRADPALAQTDKVLKVLASQNRTLATLAASSDQALAPLARDRRRVSGFIAQANATGQATAERRGDIERGIRDLPPLLTQLRPYMADLGGFADQASPVARDLNTAAPDVSRLIRRLGPFSSAALPAVTSLGKATVTGRPALLRTRPLIKDLRSFAADTRPLSTNLVRLTTSLDKTGGIERIADYLFYQTLAINGFDGIGHYLRAALLANLCVTYSISPAAGCNANFTNTRAIGSASKTSLAPALAKLRTALGKGKPAGSGKGADPSAGSAPPQGTVIGGLLGSGAVDRQRRQSLDRIRRQAKQPSPALKGTDQPMLDYLLGSGG